MRMLSRAKRPRALSPLEAFSNRGRRCVRRDAGSCARVGCARIGAYGCRGLARGRVPRDFWMVSQEMDADFAMGPGLLDGFLRQLFAVGSADLGKRRRVAAFRADSACKTAQKLQAGLACVGGGTPNVCFGFVGASRRCCDHLSSKTRLADCGGRYVGAPAYRRDSAFVGLNALRLLLQSSRCYQASTEFFRDILSDIIWPKSGQNVKMSRKLK